jgi:hypothetical protein
MLYMEDMWEEGKNKNKNVLIEVNKINNTGKQNMEASV